MTSSPDIGACAYIGGRWTEAPAARTFRTALPHDTRQGGREFGCATPAEADAAIAHATAAAAAWAATPALQRAEPLRRAAALLLERLDDLTRLLALEAGKPLQEARGEVLAAAGFLNAYAGWPAWGGQGAVKRNGALRIVQEKFPRGVAAIITPWNYPLSNPCQKIGAALIGGNPVIWRPSVCTPAVSLALIEIMHQAGFPGGVFNALIEDGEAISRALVASEAVAAVSFTGSTRVGLQVAAAAAGWGAAVQCEMGGKNAAVVMPDADLDLAAERIAFGAFGFAGQKCTAVSRVLVHRHVADAFLERLLGIVRGLRPGLPHQEESCLAPLISARQRDLLVDAIAQARERGARLIEGGAPIEDAPYAHGNYLSPALIQVHSVDDPLWTDEYFGPVLAFRVCDDLDQAIAEVNATRYGLGAALFSNDARAIGRFADQAQAGVVKINDVPPGLYPHVSTGGWKASGLGPNELSEDGVDFFLHKKSVYLA